jgi:hypothetical protein
MKDVHKVQLYKQDFLGCTDFEVALGEVVPFLVHGSFLLPRLCIHPSLVQQNASLEEDPDDSFDRTNLVCSLTMPKCYYSLNCTLPSLNAAEVLHPLILLLAFPLHSLPLVEALQWENLLGVTP